MTTIIRINLIEALYLQREKDNIPFGAIHFSKTGTSGDRLCC